LQHGDAVRAAAALAAVGLTGCFYLDPIVSRPFAFITLPDHVARDSMVNAAAAFDPARDGTYVWGVSACAVATQGANQGHVVCDDDFGAGADQHFMFRVPTVTQHGQLVTELRVKLQARDDRGVLASAEDPVPVSDGIPTLALMPHARTFTVGAPIDVFADYSDPELPYENLDITTAIDWSVAPSAALDDVALPPPAIQNPTHMVVAKRLIPQAPGSYVVTGVASDATCRADPTSCNRSAPVQTAFVVAADQPPCLAQWQPAIPPTGQTVPVGEPTVFQVPLVDDDLDPFPAVSDLPEFGTTTFGWSILPPGAAQRQPVGSGNRIVFDPGAFTPGDIVEVRVEIFDRHHPAPLPCADGAATCAITTDASCLQRQTWRVAVR
jgi:hypothetical protein